MSGRAMMRRVLRIGIACLAMSAPCASALTSASSTDLSDDMIERAQSLETPAASSTQIDATAPVRVVAPPPQAQPPAQRTLSANPLWAIPLNKLSVTRERPIFSPSRRPPPSAVVAQPVAVAAPPAKPREPERPQLSLVGTIVGGDEGFAIFMDPSTRAALRLKVGESHQGWKLVSVQGREATLEKDQQAAILALPQPGAGDADGGVRLVPVSAVMSQSR